VVSAEGEKFIDKGLNNLGFLCCVMKVKKGKREDVCPMKGGCII
jgi:hypothetical protein